MELFQRLIVIKYAALDHVVAFLRYLLRILYPHALRP